MDETAALASFAWADGPVVKVALAGDTMLGRGVAEVLATSPPTALFSDDVVAHFRGADLAIVNLECCISTQEVPWPDPA